MCASVHDLSLVSLKVLRNLTVPVPMLSVDLWNNIALIFLVCNVFDKPDLALYWGACSLLFLDRIQRVNTLLLGLVQFLGNLLLLFDLFEDIWHLPW